MKAMQGSAYGNVLCHHGPKMERSKDCGLKPQELRGRNKAVWSDQHVTQVTLYVTLSCYLGGDGAVVLKDERQFL